MRHAIIKTDNYLLVVDDSEIKTWYYDEYSKKVYHSGGTKNIVAHLPLNGYAILKDIPLLPPLEVKDAKEIIQSLLQPNMPTHFEASGVIETYTGDYNPVMLGTYIYEGGEQ